MTAPDTPGSPATGRQTPSAHRFREPLPPLPALDEPEPDALVPPTDVPAPAGPVFPDGTVPPGEERRKAAVDPVKALMLRHRELCERAVDPLEIAAGLEAHGITDRTAAHYRHRDVFSLAEEMYARVPRDDGSAPPPAPAAVPRSRVALFLLPLLPGALCAAAVTGFRLFEGWPRPAVAAAGLLAVALALLIALRHGPLSMPSGTHARRTPPCTRVWTCWLLGYALLGDGLLGGILDGGPDGLPDGTAHGPWPTATAPVLALTLGLAPAAWSARLLTVRARRSLAASRGLAEFSLSARPLLPVTFTLFLGSLAGLLTLCGTLLHEPARSAQGLGLGALLLLARLLAVHGATRATALAIGLTAGAEMTALALPLTARLPGCGPLAAPVDLLADTWGPGSIPALLCGTAALALLAPAIRTLTRASAHAGPGEAP
ncbi:hypothetical protein [Streptomyces sp. YIM S03343]